MLSCWARQKVFIDGDLQPHRQSLIYSGPGDTLLEFRQQDGRWQLLVNGNIVEDYIEGRRKSGDDTLRGLRSKAEGSYLISTELKAPSFDGEVVRRFRFIANGHTHEVRVAHRECIWQIDCDGNVVDRITHRLKEDVGQSSFELKAHNGEKLKAMLHMTWQSDKLRWKYTLNVNAKEVPHCWSKVEGDLGVADKDLPVVSIMSARDFLEEAEVETEAVPAEIQEQRKTTSDKEMQEMPQGVSFDSTSGTYQAHIRLTSGRFTFLGEFRTAEEAHQRYLEALPVYRPDRVTQPAAQ